MSSGAEQGGSSIAEGDGSPAGDNAGLFTENRVPDTVDPFEVKSKSDPAEVRRTLALVILWSLVGIYAVTIGAFVVTRVIPNNPAVFSSDALTAAIAGISGLQGLGAAVVGFYFAAERRK